MLIITVGVPVFFAGIIFASFFEWTLHRFVMHQTVLGFDYAFKAHAVVHHHTFKSDHTYHLINEKDKKTIPMAWWNGPFLIATNTILLAIIPIAIIDIYHGSWFISLRTASTITIATMLAFASYYGAYEYIHWCMHLPKARRIEMSWIFRKLNGHHLLHHRYMHKNFNVVMPLADLCLGTLLLRSKIKFPQARGPSVPDVQPKTVQTSVVT